MIAAALLCTLEASMRATMVLAIRAADGGLLCADKREIVTGADRLPVKSDAIVKLSLVGHNAVIGTVGYFKYSEGGFGSAAIFDAAAIVQDTLGQTGETEQLIAKAAGELERKYNRVLADLSEASLPKLTEDRQVFSIVVLYSVRRTVKLATIVARSMGPRLARVDADRDEAWSKGHSAFIIAPHTRLKDGTRVSIVDVISDYDPDYHRTLVAVRGVHRITVAATAVGAARKLILLTGLALDRLYGQDLSNAPISPACDCAFVGTNGNILFPYPSEKRQ
jgi:hypothetical protein